MVQWLLKEKRERIPEMLLMALVKIGERKMNLYTDKKLEKLYEANGEKCGITNVVAGNGISVAYSSDNQESEMIVYKAGKQIGKKIDN